MVKSDNAPLEKQIRHFLIDYLFSFRTLAELLDQAGISHYSSGCQSKRATFDLFPASDYVREIIAMLSLDRAHKDKIHNGFKDAALGSDYNPAHMFIQYLRRWSLFAEQVMQNEGDTPRGIAGAQAHIVMDELIRSLTMPQLASPKSRPSPRKVVAYENRPFFALMRAIGLALEAGEQYQESTLEQREQAEKEHNYLKALHAAQEKFRHFVSRKTQESVG